MFECYVFVHSCMVSAIFLTYAGALPYLSPCDPPLMAVRNANVM